VGSRDSIDPTFLITVTVCQTEKRLAYKRFRIRRCGKKRKHGIHD
jgi:hypothetical protein